MVQVVLIELWSNPKLGLGVRDLLVQVPLLEVSEGYSRRTCELRALVLRKNRKARLGDALIAQCCLDRRVPLPARDEDFRGFSEAAGLELSGKRERAGHGVEAGAQSYVRGMEGGSVPGYIRGR